MSKRRAPVETTSSRDTFELGVWSVIRLCLHPPSALPRKAAPRRSDTLYSAYREEIECRGLDAKYNPQCHRDSADVVVVASDIAYPPKNFRQERPGGKR